MAEIDEELTTLDNKVKQLKLDYEQYFSGTRPREPAQLRGEVQKTIIRYLNQPIQNTAGRFRFNSINSRYQALKRQWDVILRQIDAGSYKRHLFKARLHEHVAAAGEKAAAVRPAAAASDPGAKLFEAYREAALACGQSLSGLTPEKLQTVVKKQEAALKQKLGCEKVSFRVVVEDGKVKLKASPVRAS